MTVGLQVHAILKVSNSRLIVVADMNKITRFDIDTSDPVGSISSINSLLPVPLSTRHISEIESINAFTVIVTDTPTFAILRRDNFANIK